MVAVGIFVALLIVLLIIRKSYSKSCLEKVEVDLFISANSATEGDELVLTEIVKNEKWLPLPWLSVKFRVDRELVFADCTSVVSDFYYRHDLFFILM